MESGIIILDEKRYDKRFHDLQWLCANAGASGDSRINGIIKAEFRGGGSLVLVVTDGQRMAVLEFAEGDTFVEKFKKNAEAAKIGEDVFFEIKRKNKKEIVLQEVRPRSFPRWQDAVPAEGECRQIKRIGADYDEIFYFNHSDRRERIRSICDIFFAKVKVDYRYLAKAGINCLAYESADLLMLKRCDIDFPKFTLLIQKFE